MANLTETRSWLNDRLPALLAEHGVPGAAIAVTVDGEVVEAAGGVLSKATGVDVTTDSVFQVGSITKVWTTSLLMQLVDEGLLDLDATLRSYLPDFHIADESAAAAITIRQLLCHTAGFEGDIFTDTGKGDDCVQKYVATLGDLPQLFPPGEMFSYNNAGFCVLGRVVEVLRGKPFDDCVREHLFTPLGLTHACNGPYEAILHRAAVGHLQPDPKADPVPAPVWALARSNSPAGSMLTMSPRDLLAFAQMHIDGGTSADGSTVLSTAAVKAMQERQVTLPKLGLMGDAWGLGWELFDWDGGTVIGHDGGTIGQAAFLRIVPDKNIAIALLTNGGNAHGLYMAIYSRLLADLAGVTVPPLPTPPADRKRIDATRYLGTYTCDVVEMTVTQDDDGRIWLDQTPKGLMAEMGGRPEHRELTLLDGDTLINVEPEQGIHMPLAFVGDDGSGHALYAHHGRAIRRAEGS